jgi:hypothetical protein
MPGSGNLFVANSSKASVTEYEARGTPACHYRRVQHRAV